ncbi:MAG TPA: T9SS type A sorting domain-containing protein, partial [Bacteroidia bacterium]|nr:T9SS type A sorting domain-containing protein [Bacteroidia bacterium]
GGTAPYAYLWSNASTDASISGLAPGTYTVVVTDANGCTASCDYTVTEPAVLTATCSGTNVSCNGANDGTAAVVAAGGTAPYAYLWSNASTDASISGLAPGTYTVIITDANNCTASCDYTVTEPAVLTATCSNDANPSCAGYNDGQASVVAAGGTAPYAYLWSNGDTNAVATGLVAGTYTVVVTDANGCTATCDVTLVDPAGITISGTVTDVLCAGGSNGAIDITVSGGTVNSYLWSNGATTEDIGILTAGVYTVTVNYNAGCTSTASFTVVEPPVIIIIVNQINDVSCNGGNDGFINISASGGTGALSYLWSDGQTTAIASNLIAGTYTVVVTDANGCTSDLTVVVAEPPVLVVSINGTNISCNGSNDGAAAAVVSGGNPLYGYVWSNGAITPTISGLSAGIYTVTVTDSKGCTATATVDILEPGILVASCVVDNNVSCNGGSDGQASVSLTGGNAPYSFSWSNGATTATASGLSAGTYTVSVTDANGCTATCDVTITEPTVLTVTCSSTNVLCNGNNDGTASVVAAGGTAPYAYAWSNGSTDASISNLAPGSYTVVITDGNGCMDSCSVSITEPAVLAVTGVVSQIVCAEDSSGAIDISVTGGTASTSTIISNVTTTQNFTFPGAPWNSPGSATTVSTLILPALPAGAVINSADLDLGSFNSINGSWTSEFRADLTGAHTYTQASQFPGTSNAPGSFDPVSFNLPGFNVTGGGAINLVLSETFNDGGDGTIDAILSGAVLSINYTYPDTQIVGFYNYAWSNGSTDEDQSGLGGGVYTVTVTDDNGCTATASFTIACTDTVAPTFGSPIVTNYLVAEAFDAGLPSGWSATGLWHVTSACATGTPPNGPNWAYFGQDGTCNFDAGTVSGNLTSNVISIPATATAAELRFRYVYAGENGAPPAGFDNAGFRINGTQAFAITPVATQSVWQTATINMASFIGQNVTLEWFFSSQDGVANTGLGLQVDSITLTVIDVNAGAGCPSPVVQGNDFSQCGAVVSWTPPTAVDNCVATVTSTHNPGDFFPVGTTTVTYTATDGCGNVGTCSFDVTVNDTEAPAWNDCPPFGFIYTDCSNQYNFQPSATDNCSGPLTYTQTQGPPLGTTLPANSAFFIEWTVTDTAGNVNICQFFVFSLPQMTLSYAFTPITCNGANNGSIDLIVTNGLFPYTYLWSNGETTEDISNLGPGTYTVTVTDDNGCTASISVVLTEPALLTASEVTSNVSCFGGNDGSIDVTVSGGTAPYTYSWSNGATTQDVNGLIAGTYTVTVTDLYGCTFVLSATVTEPPQLLASVVVTDAVCNGSSTGAADLTVSGGTPAYSFLWSNGATTEDVSGLSAGAYVVTITEANGCQTQVLVNISQPAAITATAVVTNSTCAQPNTGALDITATGGTAPYSYLWSNGATTEDISGVMAGVYTVTITDVNGCTGVVSFTVGQTNTLAFTEVIIQPAGCGFPNGIATVIPSGGVGPYSITWFTAPVQNGDTASGLPAGDVWFMITDANGCQLIDFVTVPSGKALGVLLSASTYGGGYNTSCSNSCDGNITATVVGNPGLLNFLWSNGATTQNLTGVCAGTYTVSVSSGHCFATAQIVITAPPALVVSSVVNPAACGNNTGSIVASVSGGVGPYSYVWSNGQTTSMASNLAAGTYTVTVTDANGCTVSMTNTVISSGGLVLTGNSSNATCFNTSTGSMYINISGGTAPYTYLWSDGRTNKNRPSVKAGIYTITITDVNGCTGTLSFTITQPTQLTVSTTKTANSCWGGADGTATAVVSGGVAPYTYLWYSVPVQTNVTATGLKKGWYTLVVTDANGCQKSSTVFIQQPSRINIAISKTNVSTFGGNDGSATANVSGGTPGYSFVWSDGQTTQTASNLVAGTYTVTVTDANGCTRSNSVIIQQPLSPRVGGSYSDITNANLYPNPNTGLFTLSFESMSEGQVSIDIVDMIGRVVYTDGGTALKGLNEQEFRLTDLRPGMYFVTISSGDSKKTIRMVIER